MKAAVFYGPGDIRIEERPVPSLKGREILLKVEACAICGTDVRIFRHGHHNIHPPQITGHEIAGVIAALGEGVNGYKEGERVAVAPILHCGECFYCRRGLPNLCLNFEALGYHHPGAFAEYMVVPERALRGGNINRIPDNLSFEEASLTEPLACALNGELLSQVGVGDYVLVVGAGPVGCMHITLSRALGASKVIVSEVQEKRLLMSREFGADYYINPEKENLKEKLLQVTEGVGPTVIIVAAPARKAQEEALDLAAARGRINFFGGLPGDNKIAQLDSNLIHYKELLIQGTSGSTPLHNTWALEMMAAGRVEGKKLISKVVSLDELPQAIEEAESGNYLKIVVKPGIGG
ncbi:MAG TPA: zinc-dependent dehydrogenase [Candidatus Atribacteria bacterium]|nr:zinc-dependent dehydrogenase [Candidatus Atribacteria bacterium]